MGALLAKGAASGFCAAASPAWGEPTAKEVQLRMTLGGASLNRVSSVATEMGSLREATKIGRGFSPARRSDLVRRLMGCRPAPWTRARVEDEGDDGGAIGPAFLRCGEVCDTCARPVDACAKKGFRERWSVAAVCHAGGVVQEVGVIFWAAFDHVGPEVFPIFARYGGEPPEVFVGFVVARQSGEGDACLAQMNGILFEAVFPIARAAEAAGDDEFGFCRALFDVQIDGHWVL